MDVTTEQRAYARLAGVLLILNYVVQGAGGYVTILSRGGSTFEETARWATQNAHLNRAAVLGVGASWIVIGIASFALFAVLEPIGRRRAQLALSLRIGASFVGAASLMFRVAQGRLYQESEPAGPFSIEQLRALVAVSQRAAGSGVATAWMFLGAGSLLFFLLFSRSRFLPRTLSWLGVLSSALLIGMSAAMLVIPEQTNSLKAVGVPFFLTEVATALWLLAHGLPRTAGETR